MYAFSLIPLGITGARVAAPYIANLVRQYGPRVIDSAAGVYLTDKLFNKKDDEKKKSAGVAVSTPAVPPPDEDPTKKFKDIKTLTERVISSEVDKLPGGQGVKQVLGIIDEEISYNKYDTGKRYVSHNPTPTNTDPLNKGLEPTTDYLNINNKNLKAIFLSQTRDNSGLPSGKFVIDLAHPKIDKNLIEYTGQAEGNIVYKGVIPKEAIVSKQELNKILSDKNNYNQGGLVEVSDLTRPL